jgi:hypothetical protein
MSKLAKIAIILATAALVIAAKQILPLYSTALVAPPAAVLSISPDDMMRGVGPLPQTEVDNYN